MSSVFNQIFDKVYVINMEKSHDRLQYITNHLNEKNIKWERFNAIDGKKIQNDQLETNVGKLCQNFCSKPMIGCALSHKTLWQTVLDNNLQSALIMEDDVEILDDYTQTIINAWKQLPSDWDILLLGCAGLCNKNGYNDVSNFLFNIVQPFKNKKSINCKNIFIPDFPTGFFCYAVSKNGCKKLLDIIDKVNYHVDYQVSNNFDRINIYAIDPKIVFISHQPSTINEIAFPKSINKILDNVKDSNRIPYSWYMNLTIFQWFGIPFNLWSLIFIILGFGTKRFIQIQNLIILIFLLELIYFDKSLIYNLIYVIIGYTLAGLKFK